MAHRKRWQWAAVLLAVAWVHLAARAEVVEKTSRTDPLLRAALRLFPGADANRDGVLTESEAKAYKKKVESEKRKPIPDATGQKGKVHTIKVAMRDGVKLATDIWVPPGPGPYPAIVYRTPYGRKGAMRVAVPAALAVPCAVVSQDMRGLGESEGTFTLFEDEMNDGYDTVEWVAKQSWCTGKVAITGASGPGIAAKHAMMAKPPHLVCAASSVAASDVYLHCAYSGGVLRANMHDRWLRERGVKVAQWPKPRTQPYDERARKGSMAANVAGNRVALYDQAGWYDIFLQSALDDFEALQRRGGVRIAVGGFGHGNLSGLSYPPNARPADRLMDWMLHFLINSKREVAPMPPVLYYLMGDARTPGAPGNCWKQSRTWPIPHTLRSYYLNSGGGLDVNLPRQAGKLAYKYDPQDPVPTVGGANLYLPKGPMDQRGLASRQDILRFQSDPLLQPLEVTGRITLELFISTDVPDTTFMAKLIDVYPDGYEALVQDSAIMARYHKGLDKGEPLEKEKVYKLTIDLWSTALIFNKGHRIAVHVASSNHPRYEVHPNSYEPVMSYEKAPVANQTVHLSKQHPSRLLLPVIAPGASIDYP
ncbi:MAG: Cocaine esterase [Planctomycetes bacterium ADurb.Bin126]|nr:MAG: Cocaine esterase [Planctomycetes bacterium ADurb.Bin126]HQL73877.1 CocE/NonD family hydrolase [Phycisphaerae bacterium]